MILISPAKTLDFQTTMPPHIVSELRFASQSQKLVEQLQSYTAAQLSEMMHISPALAHLNYMRFAQWQLQHSEENSRAAVFAYHGPVYEGLDAYRWDESTITYAQQNLRIVSGLYGALRPLDAIQPYRLEMATPIDTHAGSTLYHYWGEIIMHSIVADMHENGDSVLINLASEEYSKAVILKKFPFKVVTPQFKDYKDGKYKMISIYAKRARGLMARYILQNQISNLESLTLFSEEGYSFDETLSNDRVYTFIR